MRHVARIDRFAGEYRWLSNFWPAPVTLGGVVYATVEHAYQAAKTHDAAARARIAAAATPGQAKRLGRRVPMRPDWDAAKETVMLDLLRQKFRPASRLGLALMQTAPALLIEGNEWGDRYWGVCRGEGKNRLGALLMQVRSELQRR